MWDCTHCGVKSIAGSVQVCPRCGVPRLTDMQDPPFQELQDSPADLTPVSDDKPEGKTANAKGK